MEDAVIMAGGFGTRLRPLTITIPKPMVPIANIPLMEHIVNLLKRHNIKEIISVLYFQPEVITSYFEDGSKLGVDMKYVLAHADYGTAGAVRNAKEYLDKRFIIISGDALTDFDLSKAIEFHKKKKSQATILLTRVNQPLQYGIVMTDSEGRITRFLEKPSWGEVFSDTVNTGIYILEPEVLDLIPYQKEFDFSKDLFPLMLKEQTPIFGYIADGYWKDIGNLEEYKLGQIDALKKNVKVKIKGNLKDNIYIGYNTDIAPTAKLKGTVIIDDNTIIGNHSIITDSVIGKNVSIGIGVKISGVTIWDNVTIGDFSELTDDVVCNDCIIGASVLIGENVYISVGCTIGNHSKLLSNIKLWPMKYVERGSTLSRSLVQEEKWQRELFTNARITGLSNIEINPEFCAKLGSALGMAFGGRGVFLASRDPDKVSRISKRAITSGIASVGMNTNDLQVNSIPQTRQELLTGKYVGGFHVRRSTRDPDKSDIIIFNHDGRDIPLSKTKTIERYFFGEDIKRVHYDRIGRIFYPERTNEIYINRFFEILNVELIASKRFKILIDYSYGLASQTFPSILGKLNADTLSFHNYVDASRYKPVPGVDIQGGEEVAKIMRSLRYELGFIMEPGSEKISIIDDRGVVYSSQRLVSIISKLFLETNRDREPYKIGVAISATNEIDEIIKDYNVEIVRIKNSHSAMMDVTMDDKVLFVAGIWGGFIFKEFSFAADGMFTVGKILEMLAQTNMKISEIDEMLPRRYQFTTLVDCPWELKGTVMRKAMEFSEKMDCQLVEGVKIFKDGSSILFLPHTEQASFIVITESDRYDIAQSLGKQYAALITNWIEGS